MLITGSACIFGAVGLEQKVYLTELPTPGQNVFCSSQSKSLSGNAIKLALHLSSSDFPVRFTTSLAEDLEKADLTRLLGEQPQLRHELMESESSENGLKITLENSKQEFRSIRVRPGASIKFNSDRVREMVKSTDLVVVCDELADLCASKILSLAKEEKKSTLYLSFSGKPISSELESLSDKSFSFEDGICCSDAIRRIRFGSEQIDQQKEVEPSLTPTETKTLMKGTA